MNTIKLMLTIALTSSLPLCAMENNQKKRGREQDQTSEQDPKRQRTNYEDSSSTTTSTSTQSSIAATLEEFVKAIKDDNIELIKVILQLKPEFIYTSINGNQSIEMSAIFANIPNCKVEYI